MKNSLIENPNSGNMLPPLTNTLEFYFFKTSKISNSGGILKFH
jgi:hypothetical protein